MSDNRGFTLVELLVAISIMGLITLVSLPVISVITENNNKSKYKKYDESLVSSAKLYTDAYTIDLFGNGYRSHIWTYRTEL